MKHKKTNGLKEFMSNFANSMPPLASLAGHTLSLGVPVPEKYPPSYVLVTQRKRPYVRVMRGTEYKRLRDVGLL